MWREKKTCISRSAKKTGTYTPKNTTHQNKLDQNSCSDVFDAHYRHSQRQKHYLMRLSGRWLRQFSEFYLRFVILFLKTMFVFRKACPGGTLRFGSGLMAWWNSQKSTSNLTGMTGKKAFKVFFCLFATFSRLVAKLTKFKTLNILVNFC